MRWPWRWRRTNGAAAKARDAKAEAERKLREARADWPVVRRAHDELAEWIETALRGHGV